jgi:hypothetical protein
MNSYGRAFENHSGFFKASSLDKEVNYFRSGRNFPD